MAISQPNGESKGSKHEKSNSKVLSCHLTMREMHGL